MKKILSVCVLIGAAAFLATASKQDKLDWCHFPPGQWTGDRATSKVLILNISENAISGHLNHAGDGPVNFEPDYPALTPLGGSCLGGCSAQTATADVAGDGTIIVHLVDNGSGLCVCPVGTAFGDLKTPIPPAAGSCGAAG